MQNKDILWAISIPFRIYNTKELEVNKYTLALSFDAALPNCNVTTARKLVQIALEKKWIEMDVNQNILRAKFELWQPKFFPPSWKPNFTNLEQVSMIDLIPLDSTIEYKPQIIQPIKTPDLGEFEPLLTPKLPEKGEEKEESEEKEIPATKEPKEKEEIIEKKKKAAPKKVPAKKKELQKGQKSISDFFK